MPNEPVKFSVTRNHAKKVEAAANFDEQHSRKVRKHRIGPAAQSATISDVDMLDDDDVRWISGGSGGQERSTNGGTHDPSSSRNNATPRSIGRTSSTVARDNELVQALIGTVPPSRSVVLPQSIRVPAVDPTFVNWQCPELNTPRMDVHDSGKLTSRVLAGTQHGQYDRVKNASALQRVPIRKVAARTVQDLETRPTACRPTDVESIQAEPQLTTKRFDVGGETAARVRPTHSSEVSATNSMAEVTREPVPLFAIARRTDDAFAHSQHAVASNVGDAIQEQSSLGVDLVQEQPASADQVPPAQELGVPPAPNWAQCNACHCWMKSTNLPVHRKKKCKKLVSSMQQMFNLTSQLLKPKKDDAKHWTYVEVPSEEEG
ncbi:hypothetical protein EXIGLDRAFT_705451 [Exidia glandulosa HHB12029]|uniref:Uncharacterized protein n=1 Tax=Exidia glandulosa HHB12029 TaxID=1314781 RepID=A0A165KJT7_EXIGL|nr:hypothetical protein EXIGLDRAFT_705451 [Exidia glandulosa HHB12029]